MGAQSVIRAIIQAGVDHEKEDTEDTRKPVVTISRIIGSGGYHVAHALAKRLGVECYGKEILDTIADNADVDADLLKKLHEMVGRTSESWLYSLFFAQNVRRDDYHRALVTTMRGLYWKGGVILGRGSHIVLAGRDVLRVRIIGSVDACAKRIAEQDDISIAQAKKKVRESNRRRGEFLWTVFRSRLNDPLNYDLIINTDNFSGHEQVVDVIVRALEAMGPNRPA
ncbi:MAG: cytidylate kinase-like family protein [Rhodospirillales bacterium]|nr:cytidylate kinase-like family protein [Rhodospirillales bacterium]